MQKLRFLAACVFYFTTVHAQVTLQQDTTSFSNQMTAAFSPLEKNRIPTGILQDYAMEFTNLQAYNGTILADSTKNTYATVLDIYNTLVSGIIGNAGTFHHPIYIDSLWQTKRQPGVVALGGLFYQYASFIDDAANKGLVTVSNGKIYDKYVNSVWQNPYQTSNVFAISAPINYYSNGGNNSVQVILPSSLWLTNSTSLISTLQADFADGSGFRTLTKDQTYNLSYTSGGTKTWTFKLTLTNGTILQSQSDFVFDSTVGGYTYNKHNIHTSSLCNTSRWDHLFDMPNGVQDPAVAVTSDLSFYGQTASGWYTIHYANADKVLRHPLIVAEGFDPDDILKPEEKFGTNNMNSFLGSISGGEGPFSTQLYDLLDNPTKETYDIIYVDWSRSGNFIERNAMLLEKIIGIINQQSGNLPIVLLGQSMGGLVSRYALRDMETRGTNHYVSMFISYDSPQQGANVPLSFQYASRQARKLYYKQGVNSLVTEYNFVVTAINLERVTVNAVKALFNGAPAGYMSLMNTDIIRGALSLQDQPSTREMLINYVNSNFQIDNTIHTDWQTTLRGIGYPRGFTGQPCTLVAVSNGSECANTQSYNPGDALLDITGNANTRFLGDLIGEIAAPLAPVFLFKNPSLILAILPGKNTFNIQFKMYSQPDGVAGPLYTGKITYTKKLLYLISITSTISSVSATSSASTLPYDYFPGGQEPTGFDFRSTSFQNAFIKYSMTVNTQQTSFCFIPVCSALDIGSGATTLTKADYLTKYIGASPPTGAKSSPFTGGFTTAAGAFSGSANNNEHHIAISHHDGDWIYNQIVGTPKATNCTAFCGYDGVLSVNGPTVFCGDQAYSLGGSYPAATGRAIQWTITQTGIPSISLKAPTNGTSVTASGTSGSGTLYASVILTDPNGNFCASANPRIIIQAGGFGHDDYPISGPTSACANQRVEFYTKNLQGATNYQWTYPSSWTNVTGQGLYSFSAVTSSTARGQQKVSVRVANACDAGGSPYNYYINIGNCFTVEPSPNPSKGRMLITVKKDEVISDNLQKIHELILADQYGNVKRHLLFKDGVTSTHLDVSNLNKGIYFLKASNGSDWSMVQIFVSE